MCAESFGARPPVHSVRDEGSTLLCVVKPLMASWTM